MGTHRFSILLDASPGTVFDVWTDLDRMTEWVGGVTSVTDVTGPIDRPGTRYVVHFGVVLSPTEVVEVERPRHIRTRFGHMVLSGESNVRFEPEGDGTRLTQELRTTGIVSAIAARLFATGSWRGSFRGELEAFRRMVDAPSTERGAGGR